MKENRNILVEKQVGLLDPSCFDLLVKGKKEKGEQVAFYFHMVF